MKIIVGLGYDTRLPVDIPPSLGQVVSGESDLLRQLEVRAGLMPSSQSEATRTVIYMAALDSANHPGRFYYRSFAVDPISCAKTLLKWRDFAILNGWNRCEAILSRGRLTDLVAVEAYLQGMDPGTGERIERLLPFAQVIAVGVSEIVLHDPLTIWPQLYQNLFVALEHAGVKLGCEPVELSASAALDSDLGQLQQALIAGVQENKQSERVHREAKIVIPHLMRNLVSSDRRWIPCQARNDEQGLRNDELARQKKTDDVFNLKGDGTVCVYRLENQQAGARYLCERALQSSSNLVIASTSLYQLNAAAKYLGAGELGLSKASCKRGPLQLLPLLINTCWQPPLAHEVLEYLTLPEGPHQSLRRKLAKQFVDLPGVGNAEWNKIIETYISESISDDAEKDKPNETCDVSDWLPIAKSGTDNEIPKTFVIQLAQQVRQYWQSRLTSCEDASIASLYFAAKTQSSVFVDALNRWPSPSIRCVHLQHLLNLVADASAVSSAAERCVSTLNVITDYRTARLSESAPDALYWWGLEEKSCTQDPPFTAEELSCLPWVLNDEQRAARDKNQLRQAILPLISVKKSVCLLMLSETPDILRLQIHNVLGMKSIPLLDEILLNGDAEGVELSEVKPLALPQRMRWWSVGAPVPAPRAKESYTSLSSCVITPHEYTLTHSARLSQGSLQMLPMDARLLGNLAHKLIENWFATHDWSHCRNLSTDIDDWVGEHLDTFIQQYALTLSAPGNRVEKLRFARQITQSLKNLVMHLGSAGVKLVLVEHQMNEQLDDTRLNGTIDLLCQLNDGRWVIIDMKWGGQRRYEAELKEGRYLQLATYARLVQTKHAAQIAEVAFMIMQSGDLIARSHKVFPLAKVIEPNDHLAMPLKVWNAFELTWQWRIKQLEKGMVEVTYGGEDSTEASFPGELALPILDIESASDKGKRSGYGQFKIINKWRVLLGELEG